MKFLLVPFILVLKKIIIFHNFLLLELRPDAFTQSCLRENHIFENVMYFKILGFRMEILNLE